MTHLIHKSGVLLLLTLTLLLCGCRTKYIPLVEVHNGDSLAVRVERDSVVCHDSIFVVQQQSGDTLKVKEYRYRLVYRDRLRTDTVSIIRVDTVRIPAAFASDIEHTKTETPWYYKFSLSFTLIALILAAAYLAVRMKSLKK